MITIADSLAISTRHRAPTGPPYVFCSRCHRRRPTLSLFPSSKLFFWRYFRAHFSFYSMFSLAKFIASNSRVFWGWLFLIVGSLSFMGFLYAAVISKIQPPSQNLIIRAIQNDWYYCFLVPLTVPILFVAVYFHWLSMKLFKHA